jgi:hypothetical protein
MTRQYLRQITKSFVSNRMPARHTLAGLGGEFGGGRFGAGSVRNSGRTHTAAATSACLRPARMDLPELRTVRRGWSP